MSANTQLVALDLLALFVLSGIIFMVWTLWKMIGASRRKPNAPLDDPPPQDR